MTVKTNYSATFADGSTATRSSTRADFTHAYKTVDSAGWNRPRTGFASSHVKALTAGKSIFGNRSVVEVAEAARS